MKKWLTLILVLGIASNASGALTWSTDVITLDIDGLEVVQIYSDILLLMLYQYIKTKQFNQKNIKQLRKNSNLF